MYEVIAEDRNEMPTVVYRTESFEEAHIERAKVNGWIKEVTVIEEDA